MLVTVAEAYEACDGTREGELKGTIKKEET